MAENLKLVAVRNPRRTRHINTGTSGETALCALRLGLVACDSPSYVGRLQPVSLAIADSEQVVRLGSEYRQHIS